MSAAGGDSAAGEDRFEGLLPTVLFAAAAVASGVLLVALGSRIGFSIDHWDVLLHRRGFSADVIFDPANEHPVIAPMLIFKVILGVFGMDSLTPFQLASTATFLGSAALLFVYVRRRVGDWGALVATLPILFLGAAADDLLLAFQIGFFGSMALGIAMLLALEREDRRADLVACALLVGSLCFSSLGIPFAIGAAVRIATRPEPVRRIFVIAVPLALYATWWLGWGHTADSAISFQNLVDSPGYVVDGFASSITALLGLAAFGGDGEIDSLTMGRVLLVLAVIAAALRLRSLPRVPAWLWVSLSIALAFWFLAALNAIPLREPTSSRYQYIGAVFIVMIAADLFRGARAGREAIAVLLTVAVVSVVGNVKALADAYREQLDFAVVSEGALGGIELAAERVDPAFTLGAENSGYESLGILDAGSYLSAVSAFGSPAYSAEELPAAPEEARVAADRVLGSIPGLALQPLGREVTASCEPTPVEGTRTFEDLPAGGVVLESHSGDDVDVRLRRFATESFPIELGPLTPRRVYELELPSDRSGEPWELELTGAGSVRACRR